MVKVQKRPYAGTVFVIRARTTWFSSYILALWSSLLGGEINMAKNGLSTLEKSLILLFVLMTGACVGLVAIYFTEKNAPTESAEGEWT